MSLAVQFVELTDTPADALLTDFKWVPAPEETSLVLTYSFAAAASDLYLDNDHGYSAGEADYDFPFRLGFGAFDESQQKVVAVVFTAFQDIIPVEFVEVENPLQADLTFAITELQAEQRDGWSFAPSAKFLPFEINPSESHEAAPLSGDIWIDDDVKWVDLPAVLLQEIGHALGLSYAYENGFEILESNFSGLSDAQNYLRYSVMSRHAVPLSVAAAEVEQFGAVSTAMALDIEALQSLYGLADNSGDDLYIINGSRFGHIDPQSLAYDDLRLHDFSNSYISIHDTGGRNVLVVPIDEDLSINLNGGSWSSTGGGYITDEQRDANLYLADGTVVHELITAAGNDYVIGSDVGNVIFTDAGNDVVFTGSGDDLLSLGAGDDRVIYQDGTDRYSGGPGRDRLELPGKSYGEYQFTTGDPGVVILTELAGDDVVALSGVEHIIFDNVSLNVDTLAADLVAANRALVLQADQPLYQSDIGTQEQVISAEDAQLYRIYFASFGRLPDAAGFEYWQGQLASGADSLDEVVSGLVYSPEFREQADADDNGFVGIIEFLDHLYFNVFGRDPDAGGYDWWAGQLGSGAHTQATAFAEMTQSDEFVLLTAATVSDYIFL